MNTVFPSVKVQLPPLETQDSPNQSARLAAVRLVVVHRPVGTYRGAIVAMCNPAHKASAHVIIREDGLEGTQLVSWGRKAWACESFNSASDNIETPDHIWTEPMNPEREFVMDVCARAVAFRLHKRSFPARYVHGADLLNRVGFTRHFDLGIAGGGHTDPTTDILRWHLFCEKVRLQLDRGDFRAVWGK